jgi:membrane fusion protein, multidrug efflux system
LAADGERDVLISLPEQAFGRFKIGLPVSVELWSQPGQRFSGRIRELSPSADPKSRTFAARIAFTAGEVPAELGPECAGVHCAGAKANALCPCRCLHLSAENGATYVWRVGQGNKLQQVAVRVGPYGQSSVPVLEG